MDLLDGCGLCILSRSEGHVQVGLMAVLNPGGETLQELVWKLRIAVLSPFDVPLYVKRSPVFLDGAYRTPTPARS